MSFFRSKSRLLVGTSIAALLSVSVLLAQDDRAIASLVGRTDDAMNLYVRSAATGAAGESRNIGNLVGRTDANMNLYVTFDSTVTNAMGTTTFPDGTAAAPSIAFTSATSTGLFYGLGGLQIATAGNKLLYTTSTNWRWASDVAIQWSNTVGDATATAGLFLNRAAAGNLSLATTGNVIGSLFKVDALPTAGTCGTSPVVTAGSTPLAGSIDVGTGTPGSCVVTFGGTAFPSAPFCTANTVTATAGTVRALGVTTTTTALTITPASAFVASTVVAWHCISSK